MELPAFRRLVATAMLNQLAASIATVALSLLVYRRTGSALGAAAFFLCSQFAPALISPLLVARLDQRSAHLVLTAIYALEGLVFLALAWVATRFALAPVLALALVDGALALTARVLARAAWTSVASPAGLLRDGNAVINAAYSVCFMIGPAVGGAVVATAGTTAALVADAGVCGLITLTIATARGLPRGVPERAPTAGRLRAALRQVRQQPLLRRLFGLQAVAILFFTISLPVEVVFAQHSLHAGAGGYGALLSVWGAGAIAGSAIYARWRKLPSRELIVLGTTSLGLGFAAMAAAQSLATALVGAAIAGIGNGIQLVAVRTAVQEAAPSRMMALTVSLSESMSQTVPGVGILLGGGITALTGPRVALAAGAAGSLVVAAAMWVGLRRTAIADLPIVEVDQAA